VINKALMLLYAAKKYTVGLGQTINLSKGIW